MGDATIRDGVAEKAALLWQQMVGSGYSTPANYEPHIDGIRCIAVLSVLFYHFGFPIIPGGFTGVDMFFVISGFLITRLLLVDVKRDNFTFRRFYLRRIRRLAPALIATLVVTFPVAAVFMTPEHLQRFSGASLASLLSVSNIYFWFEAGYFDQSASLKPLLHTWSLSVEEQFYLVWPALLFLLRTRSARLIGAVFVVLFIASLVATRLGTGVMPGATFFLMPFRVYEFALGAMLALIPLARLRHRFWSEILAATGLLLAYISLTRLNSSVAFPDINALLPCVAAALLIAFGTSPLVGLLLRNPVSVFTGRISYPLYLVHWPVIVLYKHVSFQNVIVGNTRIALIILTFALAIALHYLVENRFRTSVAAPPRAQIRRRALWLGLPMLVTVSSVHALINDGWSWRYNPQAIAAVGDIQAKQLLRREYIETPQSMSHLPFDKGHDLRLLIIGDSHSTDGFNAFYLADPTPESVSVRRIDFDDECMNLFVPGVPSTHPLLVQNRCQRNFDHMQASPLLADATHVIVSTRWERESFEFVPALVEFLQARDNTVIIMGRTAEFKNVPALVLQYGLSANITQLLAQQRDTSLDALNDELHALSNSLDVSFVDKVRYQCNQSRTACDVVNAEGKILYTDYGHWSMEGARFFGERIWADPDFTDLLTASAKSL